MLKEGLVTGIGFCINTAAIKKDQRGVYENSLLMPMTTGAVGRDL